MYLYYRTREEEEDVSVGDWFVQNSRAFNQALTIFLYIFYWLLYVKWKQLAQLAGTRTSDHNDLGSSPRSCNFSILFFLSRFHATLILRLTIHFSTSPSTCPRALTPKARIGEHATLQSKAPYWIKKSQQMASKWARPLKIAPPNSNPHLLVLSFFLFLIFFIFYYLLFFYFLILLIFTKI